MNLWHKFIIRCLPFDSMEEYNGALEYQKQEIKIYRKQWTYIVGIILFFLPAIFLLIISKDWFYRTGIVAMFIGFGLIIDTISGYYCLKLYKERGPITAGTSSNRHTRKKLILYRFYLLAIGYGICLTMVSLTSRILFHISKDSGFVVNIIITVGGILLGNAIFNYLASKGKMSWFFQDSQD